MVVSSVIEFLNCALFVPTTTHMKKIWSDEFWLYRVLSRYLALLYFRTFKIRTFKVRNWSEPHSMDSPSNQYCAISICVVLDWWPRESMLWGSLHFCTLKVQILKVLPLCQSAKVKQRYHWGMLRQTENLLGEYCPSFAGCALGLTQLVHQYYYSYIWCILYIKLPFSWHLVDEFRS